MTDLAEQPGLTSDAASVAVIMRTKDRPLLLRRAFSSVLRQLHEDWHLYLVNDGGSREELELLLATYDSRFGDRITVIHHDVNIGMEAASNSALLSGVEEFVVIHDDDDTWDPWFLQDTVAFLGDSAHTRYVAVTTACVVISEVIDDGQVKELDRSDSPWNRGTVDFAALVTANCLPPIAMLFRRSVVDAVGPFDPTLPVLGDWEFNMRLMSVGDIGYIAQPLAYYHKRVAGTNSSYSNTVVDGKAEHEIQNVLLRNRFLRRAFRAAPELLAVVQAILHDNHRRSNEVARQLATLEGRAAGSAIQLDAIGAKAGTIDAKTDAIDARTYTIDVRAEILDARTNTIDLRTNAIDVRTDAIEAKIDVLDAKLSRSLEIAESVAKLLRPLQWASQRLRPLRKVVAKRRDRK